MLKKLAEANPGEELKIIDVIGGRGVRNRLLQMGLHSGDRIKVLSRGPFGGPVFIENISTGSKLAVGRGIAYKIIVESLNGKNP